MVPARSNPKRSSLDIEAEATPGQSPGLGDMHSVETEAATLRAEVRHWLWRLLLGTALLMPLAWIVNSSAWTSGVAGWLSPLLATPVYLAIGWPLLRAGWSASRDPAHRGDLLLAAGVTLAYFLGLWHFAQHTGQAAQGVEIVGMTIHGTLLVDATLMLTFIALGKYLQAAILERTTAPLRDLLELPPENTICVREGQQVLVATHEVGVGETILIRPGQRVPLDARVLSGVSQIDQAWLTGEPRAVDCSPDSELFAGTLNGAGSLIARVVRGARDSTPQRVAAATCRLDDHKSAAERRTDQLTQSLLLLVPLAAMITCGAWLLWGNRHDAIQATIAVLISASASSLALSAKSALQTGCAMGAQHGVLIGSGKAAEHATLVTTVALDKGASITPGLPAVVELIPYDGVRREELLATAAGAAQFGDDPLSVCIHAEALQRGLRIPGTRSHDIVPGQGISARTLTGETLLGLDTWLSTMQVDVSPLAGRLSAIRAAGQSAYVVSVGTRLFGAVAAADVVAPYSRQAVGQLRALGLRVVLLSADAPAITAAAAREVTFDQVIAAISPERKPAIIDQLRTPGASVAMVGAGIGDETSLAAADLGIALDVQGNVTINAADIILPGDLRGVGRAILLSRAIFGTIRTNLGFAVVYNALLIPLAAAGLPGVIAAAATTVASVAVVANSLLLLRKRID